MITVNEVSKRYGSFLANDKVSVTAAAGELTVLLGPNGAGKSTLIKSICGLLRFTGEVSIDGLDNRSTEAKRILGYVPEMPVLYPLLTVGEHLEFIARAYRLDDWRPRADELLRRFELADKKAKLGRELSKGMQQKVSVCCALLPQPKAVVLDEPLVGLDPHGIRELKAMMADLRRDGCALLVSTHIIDSVEDDWDATYIMSGGKVAAKCRREAMPFGKTLEDVYFSITEVGADTPSNRHSGGTAGSGSPSEEEAQTWMS
ncbi:MAG: ABC transporter ATP-binding protein [Coriobacteriaceae bacterium]|jgi:ABC-type multidrug transport system ATPase subunit|nr:ABC transporter ATP-binding protein [Coriobacteriaceae bacterium]